MQFKLTYRLSSPLTLPLGHNDVLQGYLYRQLSRESEYAELLHESGYGDGVRSYKLFVFGPLEGKHEILGKRIAYFDQVQLEVRSPMPDFCDFFVKAFMHAERHELNHQRLYLESIEIHKTEIPSDRVRIYMKSPICLSDNIIVDGKRKTLYYSPDINGYSEMLNSNFRRKLLSATHVETEEKISVAPLHISEKDKCVTKFKGIYITAWKGVYQLSGPARALTFLYDTGLGSRNSQGFGMFDVKE